MRLQSTVAALTMLIGMRLAHTVCLVHQAAAFVVAPLLYRRNAGTLSQRCHMTKQEDKADEDGEQMARDFFKQVQKRDEASLSTQGNKDEPYSDDTPIPRPALDASGEAQAPVVVPRKFTGGGEQSLFSPETSQQQETPADRMREQEFNLAGRFQNTLPIQAAILAASILFISYVGLTGGITDGSERFFDDEVEIMGGYSIDDFRSDTDNTSPSSGVEIIRQADESVWL